MLTASLSCGRPRDWHIKGRRECNCLDSFLAVVKGQECILHPPGPPHSASSFMSRLPTRRSTPHLLGSCVKEWPLPRPVPAAVGSRPCGSWALRPDGGRPAPCGGQAACSPPAPSLKCKFPFCQNGHVLELQPSCSAVLEPPTFEGTYVSGRCACSRKRELW